MKGQHQRGATALRPGIDQTTEGSSRGRGNVRHGALQLFSVHVQYHRNQDVKWGSMESRSKSSQHLRLSILGLAESEDRIRQDLAAADPRKLANLGRSCHGCGLFL